MKKPSDNEEIRLVAILLTLNYSHENVRSFLKIRKERVSDIAKWLEEAHFEEDSVLFNASSIQKTLLSGQFTAEASHIDLIRGARLTQEDILKHFRPGYKPNSKEPFNPFSIAESTLHQEHHKGMLELINLLITDLKPNLSSPTIRKLKDSKKLNEDAHIHFESYLNENPEMKIVKRYLDQHLISSLYSWVINDKDRGITKWISIVDDELNWCIKLLKAIDRKSERMTGFAICNPNSIGYIGPSYWFSDSIFDAILERLYRDLDYELEPLEKGLFGMRYGPAFIGQSEIKEDAEKLREYHRQLMVNYKKNKTVRNIKRNKKERETVAKEITGILYKFIVDKHIPGNCDYEFCG